MLLSASQEGALQPSPFFGVSQCNKFWPGSLSLFRSVYQQLKNSLAEALLDPPCQRVDTAQLRCGCDAAAAMRHRSCAVMPR